MTSTSDVPDTDLPDLDPEDVAEDPDLGPAEKSVGIVFTRADDGRARVHSELSTVTRYCIRHPAVDVVRQRVVDGTVVAVTADVPLGLLKLGAKPRKSSQVSGIVSSGQLRARDDSGGGEG